MHKANDSSVNMARIHALRGLMLLTLLLGSYQAVANSERIKPLIEVGQADMSWFFIDLYQATLYSQDGRYQEDAYPQALNILYHKSIERQDLLSATKKQWQKIGMHNEQSRAWLFALNGIWPDIKKGDQLLFRVEPDGLGYFYHNGRLLGGLDSVDFSHAFLAIWLSEKTTEPKLRQQLIGQ